MAREGTDPQTGTLAQRSDACPPLWVPAFAGTPRYEDRGTGWRVFSTVVRD